MTKPIEGWVRMDNGKPCVECNGHTKDGVPFGKKIVVVLEDPDHSGYYPVFIASNYRGESPRLVLEDEPEIIGDGIADAIRKERERILEELQKTTPIIRLKQGGGIEVDLLDIQKAIFGEEK